MTFRKSVLLFAGAVMSVMQAVSVFAVPAELILSQPGTMVLPESEYSYPLLKGVKFDPDNPLELKFIIDSMDNEQVDQEDAYRLIEYFLTGLAMPPETLWVNLAPYEQHRILADELADTALGRDMLAQDYELKQLAASLTHPDTDTGKAYWNGVQGDLSKVWIVPEHALVKEYGTEAFIFEAVLDVESETSGNNALLPAIKREVNTGKTFAVLRQIHYSLIMAEWFKRKFSDTFYKMYINTENTTGINIENGRVIKEEIFSHYTSAFNSGAFNVTRKVRNNAGNLIKKRYFSGGVNEAGLAFKSSVVISALPVTEEFSGSGYECSAAVLSSAVTSERAAEIADEFLTEINTVLPGISVVNKDAVRKRIIKLIMLEQFSVTIKFIDSSGGPCSGTLKIDKQGGTRKRIFEIKGDKGLLYPGSSSFWVKADGSLYKTGAPEQVVSGKVSVHQNEQLVDESTARLSADELYFEMAESNDKSVHGADGEDARELFMQLFTGRVDNIEIYFSYTTPVGKHGRIVVRRDEVEKNLYHVEPENNVDYAGVSLFQITEDGYAVKDIYSEVDPGEVTDHMHGINSSYDREQSLNDSNDDSLGNSVDRQEGDRTEEFWIKYLEEKMRPDRARYLADIPVSDFPLGGLRSQLVKQGYAVKAMLVNGRPEKKIIVIKEKMQELLDREPGTGEIEFSLTDLVGQDSGRLTAILQAADINKLLLRVYREIFQDKELVFTSTFPVDKNTLEVSDDDRLAAEFDSEISSAVFNNGGVSFNEDLMENITSYDGPVSLPSGVRIECRYEISVFDLHKI